MTGGIQKIKAELSVFLKAGLNARKVKIETQINILTWVLDKNKEGK